ncbi:DUF493 family protein YbeD [Ferrimonas balearica]|uniref:DUF493 family protein YbeD n=1 Tax=Ferrimonas balearica TaxID=44012 RepID=UPI001C99FDC4|nr:DUF493 family protein YbeD [Ferrimonas balearica]MBY5921511.1 DUF493 family protein YbeD [Ferrimonas balearica]MBY5995804.1 DUF493 family protein YbeD [Ferrimonas balearica]
MNTKFDEYLDFPCKFPFKVLGLTDDTLADRVVAVLQQHAPGDYIPSVKPSSKGTYISVSVTTVVTSKEHIELLYTELAAIDGVRGVL